MLNILIHLHKRSWLDITKLRNHSAYCFEWIINSNPTQDSSGINNTYHIFLIDTLILAGFSNSIRQIKSIFCKSFFCCVLHHFLSRCRFSECYSEDVQKWNPNIFWVAGNLFPLSILHHMMWNFINYKNRFSGLNRLSFSWLYCVSLFH